MRKVILAFTALFMITSGSISQGWIQQSSGTTQVLYSVDFVNDQTGFAAGNEMLRTTNGGTNWSVQFGGIDNLYSVFFPSVNTGWVVGGMGQIHKTTNAGVNWVNVSQATSNTFQSAYFINDQTGWLAGTGVYKTTNGGLNWTQQNFGIALFYSVYFTDINTGWVAGGIGQIFKTTNGGTNWTQQTSNTTAILRSIYFINSMTGWTTGTDSKVYKSVNGGTTWTMYYNQSLCGLYSVYFASEQTGWVCGCEGAINGTTNNGTNWVLQSFGSTTVLYSVNFINSSTGWAVGAGGRILKTTSGGLTGVNQVTEEIPGKFSLSQNYPNPFNPNTIIRFNIKDSRFTILKVFDILGNEVESLVNEQLIPATYEVEWNASNYTSGIYYYRLTAGDFAETRKMILLK